MTQAPVIAAAVEILAEQAPVVKVETRSDGTEQAPVINVTTEDA